MIVISGIKSDCTRVERVQKAWKTAGYCKTTKHSNKKQTSQRRGLDCCRVSRDRLNFWKMCLTKIAQKRTSNCLSLQRFHTCMPVSGFEHFCSRASSGSPTERMSSHPMCAWTVQLTNPANAGVCRPAAWSMQVWAGSGWNFAKHHVSLFAWNA